MTGRNDSPAAVRSLPPDQLKDKVREIRERVEVASEPAGPLTLIFGVTTSSS